MSKNAVCDWDFTLKAEGTTKDMVIEKLKEFAKKWTFQLEKGASGYIHYQGRISLKVKSRTGPNIFKGGIHWSPTSSANRNNDFYVSKNDTRIDGPWSDKDIELYIPKQFRDKVLYDWQQEVLDTANVFNDRIIDLIYDETGNKGKSTLASIAELLHGAIDVPPINDCKEVIQYVCNECMDNNIRDPKLIFIDLPRAMNKDNLNGMYSAIETIKKGKLVDTRYHTKKWWIDSPRIWVFSNHLPDKNLLSNDRWRIWTIKANKLVSFLGEAKASVILPKKLL